MVTHPGSDDSIVARVHEQLLVGSQPRGVDIEAAVDAMVPGLAGQRRREVIGLVEARLVGLADLQSLLNDPAVTDVMINGPGPVTVERAGCLAVAGSITAAELDHLVEFLLGPTGRRVDRRSPIVDVRLDHRTRCHIVAPPVAVGGPFVSLRRFPAHPHELSSFGDPALVRQLEALVDARASALIYGPTGSGKTALLASLLQRITERERIVIVEEAAELPIRGRHVVRLEAQPPNVDGAGAVELAQLVAAALRMRPDRIVVGEVRGPEAAGLVHALATGHRGSMGTIHAGSLETARWRLGQLARDGGVGGHVDQLVSRVLDVAIELGRDGRGHRQVVAIHQVTGGVR